MGHLPQAASPSNPNGASAQGLHEGCPPVDPTSRLVELQHLKYDDVEIPGHHLEHKDSYPDFITIARFSPTVHLCCGNSFCFRQITFIGHDHDGFKRPLSRFVSHALSSDGYSDEGKSEKDSNIPHPDCTAHDALAKTA
ncbi:uncharacterized protein EI90DRAFT_3021204 [Cantharellus anzutake]|uniref:uncharacterized protein n=1 Tax=Cantharellus anzutake TaxID=1750568 RepID=UPI001902FE99|nr:uncharacterized protein EI90DRAFT_3021204 [Cantharellus anzutake]KAF8318042.1 hypothetical protein EI90DRAFT_3021204 [Cantharellus anzutake]